MILPKTPSELAEAIRSTPRVLAVGAGTKPRLSAVDVPKLSTTRLSGIVEYEPDEFTFTALAGTPVREITAALAQRGQYLPFDPMLLDAGATIGGTVASGLSGPGRFRYGGLRDFILGVRFVDGMGRLLHMGGKVVKNAAGFDLPKFFVGSLGRFGVIAEVTFKVFPRAAATRTLKLMLDDVSAAAKVLMEAANTRWEVDALELLPDGRSVLVRLAAPEPALDAISKEILARWTGAVLTDEEAARSWLDLREFRWAHAEGSGELVRVPLTPVQVPALYKSIASLNDARLHVSAGGNVGFVSCREATELDAVLRALNLEGVTLRGATPLWLGLRRESKILHAVKEALDPQQRFPSLDD
jgi:glycolate oxidase FAD binding subunit